MNKNKLELLDQKSLQWLMENPTRDPANTIIRRSN